MGWIDADTIYVGTDFGPGSLTSTGYPRIVKRWRRGHAAGRGRSRCSRATPTTCRLRHARPDARLRARLRRARRWTSTGASTSCGSAGELHRIDVPQDADVDVHREWLLVRHRAQWTVGGATYPAGALLATDLDAWMAGERDSSTVLFEPDARTSLQDHAWTRHHLLLTLLDDVRDADGGADAAGRRLGAGAARRRAGVRPAPTWSAPTRTPATSTCSAPAGSSSRPRCGYGVGGRRAGDAQDARRRSSTPTACTSASTSPPPRTAPASRTSWSARRTPRPGRPC